MTIRALKRKIGLLVQRNRILRGIATDINFALFHWDKKQQDISCGEKNPNTKFYVIRSSNLEQGLLSLYLRGLWDINSVIAEGYTPIVDYEHSMTQYNVKIPVNGTSNAWEYYFEQPSKYTLEEVYISKKVRLSGWKFFAAYGNRGRGLVTQEMMSRAPVKKYIYDLAYERVKADRISDMIGILVRGTDYVRLKPSGHAVAPTPEQASEKLDEFLERYGKHKIFLATEDAEIYRYFALKYGDMIYSTDKNLVNSYSGNDYIAKDICVDDRYKFGLDYLVKMICLSKCRYLIASMTAGTEFALLVNDGRYEAKYIFDLGRYS